MIYIYIYISIQHWTSDVQSETSNPVDAYEATPTARDGERRRALQRTGAASVSEPRYLAGRLREPNHRPCSSPGSFKIDLKEPPVSLHRLRLRRETCRHLAGTLREPCGSLAGALREPACPSTPRNILVGMPPSLRRKERPAPMSYVVDDVCLYLSKS